MHSSAADSPRTPSRNSALLPTPPNAALVDRANTKVSRVGATKGIEQEIQPGGEAVTMLHAVISRQFAGDPTFLAAWNAARRVTGKPDVVRAVKAPSVAVT
jgi:hypothetical protein